MARHLLDSRVLLFMLVFTVLKIGGENELQNNYYLRSREFAKSNALALRVHAGAGI